VPRRRQQGLERVLGAPALFATAYGNVGSSIYYALGVTAGIALGLTPLVFVISGVIFAATATDHAEGTVRFPRRAGRRRSLGTRSTGSSRSGRPGRRCSTTSSTVAISAFFVPHYLSIFWEPPGRIPGT
jgi:APA family basic amino acid/polyamine antiporter